MNNYEIEFKSDPTATRVALQITIPEPVAISDGALMFHAGIRDCNQLVAVFIKRIVSKPMLKRFKRAGNFLELPHRRLLLMRQDPVVNIQHTTFTFIFFREVYVVADVDVNTVIIDWIQDFPMKRLLLSRNIMVRLFQTTV